MNRKEIINIKFKVFFIFTLILLFYSCKKNSSNKVEDNFQIISKNKKETKFELDTITIEYLNKNYPYTFDKTSLKNGYNLDFNYFRKNKNSTIEMCLNLRRGNEIIDTLNILGYAAPHKNLGYVFGDFDKYFAFVQSFGSGNPHEMQLLRKRDAKEILKGFIVDKDEKNNLLLYCKGDDSLMLYDITKNKNNYIENLRNSKEIDCKFSELSDYLKIKKVNSKYVFIDISNTRNKTITKKY